MAVVRRSRHDRGGLDWTRRPAFPASWHDSCRVRITTRTAQPILGKSQKKRRTTANGLLATREPEPENRPLSPPTSEQRPIQQASRRGRSLEVKDKERMWERKHSGLALLFLCGSLGADCGELARLGRP